MIPTIGPADRKELELGLKRLKLRWIRDHLDELSEIALQEESSYLDYLAYLVKEEVRGRDETQVRNALKAARFPVHGRLDKRSITFCDRPVLKHAQGGEGERRRLQHRGDGEGKRAHTFQYLKCIFEQLRT